MTELKETPAAANFIQAAINEDLLNNRFGQRVHTRFPPEPNGYLHIGHAKSICLNFGTAAAYQGLCNLRFDDTNPAKEETEFIESIKEDIHWLGFDWEERLFFASDYFEKIYQCAVELIEKGLAYVCHLTPEEMRQYRGTPTEPGKSPYRDRSIEENLALFADMRAGKFADGECTLRAKIDMASPNFNMRDPVIYRIQRSEHHRTGNAWCIYPMYDFAHPISDALEGITHSICTLEFEIHRPLYDWVLDHVSIPCHSRQIEFARLNITGFVMSKRRLRRLVEEGFVQGWDDPRMPTISGLRRRGYTPSAIRDFCERIGVAKSNSIVEYSLLEHCIREDLDPHAYRVMTVLDPIKVVLTNYPAEQTEQLPADNNPQCPEQGKRLLPFSKELYIEREDFMEDPPKKYHRLTPGGEVRLKHAYIIRCEEVVKDADGNIVELHCTYDPSSKSGQDTSGKKVKGTIHWVDAAQGVDVEVRLYDRLFSVDNPEDVPEGVDFTSNLNPDSLKVVHAKAEPSLAMAMAWERFQFLRHGFFMVDPDSTTDHLIFNRIVSLKDSWAKIQQSQK